MVKENVNVILWVDFCPKTIIQWKRTNIRVTIRHPRSCSTRKQKSSHFFVGVSSHYLSDSKYWSLIKEQGRNSDPSVKLLNSSVLAYTSESIKPQAPGGATTGHTIICQSPHVQCPHTVALTKRLQQACKHTHLGRRKTCIVETNQRF